ncbi:MAG: class I SAM-dependent methyltransferase [Elusimicrobia bacterium]|nr:class I SAM-dependent methyltransferase [Elusimicrobiota bacterium]
MNRQAQVDGVERYITLEPRARVLDLACGSGRQTLELARRGYRVLGVDSAEGPLAEARAAARQERLNAHFLHTDIRQISYRGEFDAVVNLHSSIGCLPNDRDHLRVLEGVRKGLKSGGRLLLDMPNREWLMRHSDPGSFDLQTGRRAGQRVYALTELKALLERAGLECLEVWGGYEGEAYGMDSPRMVVLAQRAAEAAPRRPKDEGLVSAIRIKGRSKGR